MFHDVLDGQGYEIELSNYTFEGVRTVEILHPDLIILDFERDGNNQEWQFLKMLKFYETTTSIPIIICLSPLSIVQGREISLQQKNIHVLFSPVLKDELLATVHAILPPPDGKEK